MPVADTISWSLSLAKTLVTYIPYFLEAIGWRAKFKLNLTNKVF
jgi:hypothetical protein